MSRTIFRLAPLAAALMLGACAGDTPNFFQTASVAPAAVVADATPSRTSKVSAECSTLANQIDALRKDGTIERLEKVASGKGDNVQVKRAALAKQAELNKANGDYLSKCAPRLPAAQQAAASPMAPVAAPAAAAAAAPVVKASAAAKAAATAAQPSGVTVAPSAATAPKQ